jgi:hypothetical protein
VDWWGRAALWAGAAVDALFGAAVLLNLPFLAALMGLLVPREPVYVKLAGLLLLGLSGMYALAALWPERYAGNVAVAAALRLVGAVWFLAMVRSGEAPPVFLSFALMDALLGLAHAAYAAALALRSEKG